MEYRYPYKSIKVSIWGLLLQALINKPWLWSEMQGDWCVVDMSEMSLVSQDAKAGWAVSVLIIRHQWKVMRDSKAAEATTARIYETTFSEKNKHTNTGTRYKISWLYNALLCLSASLHLAHLGHGVVWEWFDNTWIFEDPLRDVD